MDKVAKVFMNYGIDEAYKAPSILMNILYDKGACEMILEGDCNKESLRKKINSLLSNPFLCEDMILRQREMHIDNSLARIIKEIL